MCQKPLSPKPGALSYPFTTPPHLSFRWIGANYDDVEPFIDSLDRQVDPGLGLMAGYLNALEFEANRDGQRLDFEDVVLYEPVIRSFIVELLAMGG